MNDSRSLDIFHYNYDDYGGDDEGEEGAGSLVGEGDRRDDENRGGGRHA